MFCSSSSAFFFKASRSLLGSFTRFSLPQLKAQVLNMNSGFRSHSPERAQVSHSCAEPSFRSCLRPVLEGKRRISRQIMGAKHVRATAVRDHRLIDLSTPPPFQPSEWDKSWSIPDMGKVGMKEMHKYILVGVRFHAVYRVACLVVKSVHGLCRPYPVLSLTSILYIHLKQVSC